MLEIDFEKVTKRIENYIVMYYVGWKNGSYNTYNNTSLFPRFMKKPYPSYIGKILYDIVKCYAINIPMNASFLSIELKKDIFPEGIRPTINGLGVAFHYPNQFFRSFDNLRLAWPKDIATQNKTLVMTLNINTFEVGQRYIHCVQ